MSDWQSQLLGFESRPLASSLPSYPPSFPPINADLVFF
jgi:hypothetical protein